MPYKLIKKTTRLLVFSNGSGYGWLFFLCGIIILSLLLHAGFFTKHPLQKEIVAWILFGGTSVVFSIVGLIAGIGTSKLIINLTSKTYCMKNLSITGVVTVNGPLSDLFGIRLEVKNLTLKGGNYPVFITKLLSKKFKQDLIVGLSRSEEKMLDLSEMLSRQLAIPVIQGVGVETSK